jgi:hypothetical protein
VEETVARAAEGNLLTDAEAALFDAFTRSHRLHDVVPAVVADGHGVIVARSEVWCSPIADWRLHCRTGR